MLLLQSLSAILSILPVDIKQFLFQFFNILYCNWPLNKWGVALTTHSCSWKSACNLNHPSVYVTPLCRSKIPHSISDFGSYRFFLAFLLHFLFLILLLIIFKYTVHWFYIYTVIKLFLSRPFYHTALNDHKTLLEFYKIIDFHAFNFPHLP